MSNEPSGLTGKAAKPEIEVIGLSHLLTRLRQRRLLLLLCFYLDLLGWDLLRLNLPGLDMRF